MAESGSKWWLQYVIIPVIIGGGLGIYQYVLPKILDKDKELSYEIVRPTDKALLKNISIIINGEPVSNLFLYKVRLWNSGHIPLEKLPVLLKFGTNDESFKILSISNKTVPIEEFGDIRKEDVDYRSIRRTYALLNEGDQDLVTLLTNKSPRLKIYSKAKGVKVIQAVTLDTEKWFSFVAIFIGVFASFTSLILRDVYPYILEKLKNTLTLLKG